MASTIMNMYDHYKTREKQYIFKFTEIEIIILKNYFGDDIIRLLQISPNIKTKRGITILIFASFYGYEDIVKKLLNHPKIDLNMIQYSNDKHLIHIINYQTKKLIHLLPTNIINEPDLTLIDIYCEINPLIAASLNNQVGVIRLLLEQKKINPDIITKEDITALIAATKYNHHKVVSELLKHKLTDPNLCGTKLIMQPLVLASNKNYIEIVKILLNHSKIDPNVTSFNNRTPLLTASFEGYTEIASILFNDIRTNIYFCNENENLVSVTKNIEMKKIISAKMTAEIYNIIAGLHYGFSMDIVKLLVQIMYGD